MDAKEWALEHAGSSDAAFFTAAYATEKGLKSEAVLACRLPEALDASSLKQEARPPEAYMRPAISAAELDDGRHVLVAWFGIRLVGPRGEARWLARINPCDTGDTGFATLKTLPEMDSIKLHVYSGEEPLAFEIAFGTGLKAQLARVLGAATGSDRFSDEEFEGTVRLQLEDSETREALIDELFPDQYPS